MSGENYVALFDIVKILLVLSHGQASVELGFSINKEIEVENLHEHSLVAQPIICDHLRAVGVGEFVNGSTMELIKELIIP